MKIKNLKKLSQISSAFFWQEIEVINEINRKRIRKMLGLG